MLKNLYLNTIHQVIEQGPKFDVGDCRAMSSQCYYEQRRTIRLDFGRVTGKTAAAIEFLKLHSDASMVVMNMANARWICRAHPEIAGQVYHPSQLFDLVIRHYSDIAIMPERNRGLPFEDFRTKYLILDEPMFFLDRSISGHKFNEFLYERLPRMGVDWVIKLGMQ